MGLNNFVNCSVELGKISDLEVASHRGYCPLRYVGHSLLELLLALSLLSISLTVSLAVWHPFVTSNQVRALTEHVLQAVYYARHYAITHQDYIRLCGSSAGQCDGHWGAGFLIVDKNAKILRRFPAVPAGYRLLWRGNFSWNESITFTPEGFTRGQQGSFYFCPPLMNHRYARALVLSFTGKIRLKSWNLAIDRRCYAGK